jgi:type VI protein secretion system component VasK
MFEKYLCKLFNKKEVYLADLGDILFFYGIRTLLVIAIIALIYSLWYVFTNATINQIKSVVIEISLQVGVVIIMAAIALIATFAISAATEWIDKKAHEIKIAECPNNPRKP